MKRSPVLLAAALLGLLILVLAAVSLIIGPGSVGVREILHGLSPVQQTILLQLRLPRVLMAFFAGLGLSVSGALMGAAMAMQGAEVAPTARQVAACSNASKQLDDVMKRWTAKPCARRSTRGLSPSSSTRSAAWATC